MYEGKPIPFFGDGDTARDYTYIDDIVQGVLGAIDHPYPFEVFNLGESYPVPLSKLVRLIQEIANVIPDGEKFDAPESTFAQDVAICMDAAVRASDPHKR